MAVGNGRWKVSLNDKMSVGQYAHKIGKSPVQIGLWILYLLLLAFSFSVSQEKFVKRLHAQYMYMSILQK
jgi:hypothetical protein